jgi:hypothetical protein
MRLLNFYRRMSRSPDLEVLTGIVLGNQIQPHTLHDPVPLTPRLVRKHGLANGDRVAFKVDSLGEACEISVYAKNRQ